MYDIIEGTAGRIAIRKIDARSRRHTLLHRYDNCLSLPGCKHTLEHPFGQLPFRVAYMVKDRAQF